MYLARSFFRETVRPMLMTEYETTVVVRPDISGDVIESTLDRVREAVKKSGGKLVALNHWGKKKLAYPIEKHTRGIYVQAHYLGQGGLVAEIERNLRISESVLRYLTVKIGSEVPAEERQEKEYVRPAYEAQADVPDDEPIFGRDDRRDRDRDDRDDEVVGGGVGGGGRSDEDDSAEYKD
jgi:small subunit ribosomal protein S6